jgi:hypothetical protein
MRTLALVPLVLLAAGCLAPGERDPTRYPWDRRNLAAAPHPPLAAHGAIAPLAPLPSPAAQLHGDYCVVALDQSGSSGIVVGGKAPAMMACSAPERVTRTTPKE